MLCENDQRWVADVSTGSQTELLEEAPTGGGQILDHRTADVLLEVEQIDFLPVRAIAGQNPPILWARWWRDSKRTD